MAEPWLRAGYRPLGWGDLVEAVVLLPLAAAAGLVMTRRGGAPLGPLLAAIAVLFALAHVSDAAVWRAVRRGPVSEATRWLGVFSATAIVAALVLAAAFPLLLVPDGRLPSRRWRPVVWAIAVAVGAYLLGIIIDKDTGTVGNYPFADPPGTPHVPAVASILQTIGYLGVLAGGVAGIVSVVVRWLRRRTGERAGLAIVLGVAVAPTAATLLATAAGGGDSDALQLPWLACFSVLVPASVILAALVDGPDTAPLLARRLTLGGLLLGGLIITGAVALIAGLAAGRKLGAVGGIGAGLLVVLALVPLGRIARRGAVRLLYGERDSPAALHARLSSRVRAAHAAEDALLTALADLRAGLRLSYAGVHLADAGVLAGDGELADPTYTVELAAYGAPQGSLVVGARTAGEALTSADKALLADLAPHVAAMAHSALLLAELRRSRTRIVLAREEERRRLRRDLHDGLGAALSGIGYGLDAAAAAPAGRSADQLAALRGRLTDTQAELRQIIDDLVPSRLDSADLAAAIRADVRSRQGGRTQINVDIPGPELGGLPAAVELAAFRIVQEALTNALRHADARHVQVRLHRRPGGLCAAVEDDGCGISDSRPAGVGLTSMAERAAEIGGNLTVTARPGSGILVEAVLPIPAAYAVRSSRPMPSEAQRAQLRTGPGNAGTA
ncbi:MAG TPA: sensor histidine kinase [Trebonia sp.]|nr:sensor histidine kinase [Trebonia sp.]